MQRATAVCLGVATAVAFAGVAAATEYDLAKQALLVIKRMAVPTKAVEDVYGLRGLEYIDGVVVEGLSDDLIAAGVSASAMRDVVETRLGDGGWHITGVPTIPTEHVYVRVSGVELRTGEGARYGWYAVSAELSLRQPAFLERLVDDATVQTWATTWDTTALVFSPQSDLRDDIASELARQATKLVADWKRANAP
ncbi:hypothetical protein HN937_29695 [Candidatus Poribacteria bacterium]|nr:hypothetical protein [Candidatus Poribacteria bacterium]